MSAGCTRPNLATGKTRVKLCGMTRVEDIVAVNEARPDFIGFVVDVPGSRRSVSCHEFEQLSADRKSVV